MQFESLLLRHNPGSLKQKVFGIFIFRRYNEQMKTWRPDPLNPEDRPVEIRPETGAELIAQIERVRTIVRSDPSVMLIILEEAPAYFLDQKSVDEVCKNIQNRCKAVVNER